MGGGFPFSGEPRNLTGERQRCQNLCLSPLLYPFSPWSTRSLSATQFLREVYALILSEISSEFEGFQKEKEKLRIELEKKIRPDLDQMLTLKDQIASKLQGWANGGETLDRKSVV